jgi:GAF domain-containing protein
VQLATQTNDLLELTIQGVRGSVLVQNIAKVARMLGPAETRAAVLVHDRGRGTLKVAGAEGFTSDFREHAEEIPVNQNYPSCGRCAATGAEVYVKDVRADPAWIPFLPFAERHGIRACWSFPIAAQSGVLGTIAIYQNTPSLPAREEAEAIRNLSVIAAIALGADPWRAHPSGVITPS